MKTKIISIGALAFLGFLLADACAKKPAPVQHAKAPATSTALQCPAAALGSTSASPTNLALADLSVNPNGVSISTLAYSNNTGVNQISIDDSMIGSPNADTSPTFMVWKACGEDNKNCTNNGQWTKEYSYDASSISNFPSGVTNVTIAICVSHLEFLSEDARKAAKNECEASAPCYCGTPVTVKAMNNLSSLDAAYKSAVEDLNAKKQEMLTLSQNYVNVAREYVSQCSTQDKGTPGLQYAMNITSLPPVTIALEAEQLGSYMQEMVIQAKSGAMNLAGDTSACTPDAVGASSGGVAPDQPIGDNSGDGSSPTPTPSPTPSPTPTPAPGTKGPATEVTASADTSTASTSTTDSKSSLSTGARAGIILGLGIPLLGVGAYFLAQGIAEKTGWFMSPNERVKGFWNKHAKPLFNKEGKLKVIKDKIDKLRGAGKIADSETEKKKFEETSAKRTSIVVSEPVPTATHNADELHTMDGEVLTRGGSTTLKPSTTAVADAEKVASAEGKAADKAADSNIKAKGGLGKMIGGAIAVIAGITIIGVAASVNLEGSSCGNFMATASQYEGQLGQQQQKIKTANDNLSSALINALQSPGAALPASTTP